MNLSELAGSVVERNFTAETLRAAEQLVADGRVSVFEVGDDLGHTRRIDAIVTDRHPEMVGLWFTLPTASIQVSCVCGEGTACVHVAAALLEIAGADTGLRVPPWRQELDRLLPPAPTAASAELCVLVRVADHHEYRARRTIPRVEIRPGMRGARGGWIKGSAGWDRYENLEAPREQLALLAELDRLTDTDPSYYYSNYDTEWRGLHATPSRTLWPLLEALAAAGVPLVSAAKEHLPVVLDGAPAEARLAVTARSGALAVAAEVRIDGAVFAPRPLALLGDPAVALAETTDAGSPRESLVLHPFTRPVSLAMRQLLDEDEPVTVDEDGREEFERAYLPRLRVLAPVHSPDDSYDPPPPPQVTLELGIAHGDRHTNLTWEWDRGYAGAPPDPEREEALVAAVIAAAGAHAGLVTSGNGSASALRDRMLGAADTAVFVAEVLPGLRMVDGLRIVEDSEAPDYRAATGAPVVAVSTEPRGNDWLDLHVTVTIDDEEVDFADLFTALARDEPLLVLPSGTYFPLDDPELQRLRAIIAEASALSDRPDRPSVSRYQVDLWDELTELGLVAAQEAEWWLKVRALSGAQAIAPVAVPPTLRATLRDYQHAGLSWLEFLRTHQLGGVLADDMGLGKTVQTIAMIERARGEDAEMAPFLVVAPTSVVGNWAAECARFAPDLVVRTIEATERRRGAALAEHVAGAHVVVTSYALFRIEAEAYRGIRWSGLILDEAQQIKNPASQGYRAARALDVPFTLVITGTPLENNLLEFWALVSLACPGLLGGRKHFTEFFRTPIEREADAARLATLQRRVRPFVLRRTKDLVADELPAKQEQVLELDLHPVHRRLYDRRLQRERQKLLGLVDDMAGNSFQIFRTLTLLRQLALDPALVDEGQAPSAKLETLVELLIEAAAEGHRVLVISQFTRFLARAREAASAAGLDYAYLDGSTAGRQKVIDGFRSGTAPVFFVSLKAGGFGLNLVEADYVVLLDPWWNPAVEAQAIDRTHRLGQTRPVVVYRLVARGTIEQKVMDLKTAKSQLFSRVLDEGGALEPGALTADDIRGLVE